jgi:metallo-beta-lactamase family protein
MASLTFLGAIRGVTGSNYLLETENARVLLDCGLIQGTHEEEELNRSPFPYDIKSLDAVVLSHAHLDHSGRLPKLVAEGYNNSIYMTRPTVELLEIMLNDAAGLDERDTEWENKKRRRAGKPEIEPLYTAEHVEQTLDICSGIAYGEKTKVAEGIEICFRDAGHILGSSIVEVFINEHGQQRKLVFSGDLGNSYSALLRDPAIVTEADTVLLESTYGDRDHQSLEATLDEFREIIRDASKNGGNILIPSFAVGRTQEIIFRLGEMYQDGELRHQAVYLDSPMAIATTEVYHRYQHVFNSEDKEAIQETRHGSLHTFLPVLRYSKTTEESMALNRITEGAIIIAGSGMCNGGRIRHHLKHNLWRRKSHVVIVGYQAIGTTGRALVDGAKKLRIVGEEISVNARIHTLGGFSAHASQSQLIDWINNFKNAGPDVYLVHGDPEAKTVLYGKLKQSGWNVQIPEHGEKINL